MLKPKWRGGRQEQPAEPAPVAGRVPPYNLDCEAAVLSAIMLERDAYDRVCEMLTPEHFYSDANRRIYEAATKLAAEGTPIDIVTIASWLRSREWIHRIGGPSYLAQLADATPAVAHVAAHAAVVVDKWITRQMIAACQRIDAEGYGDIGNVREWLDKSEQAIFDVRRKARESIKMRPMRDVVKQVFTKIVENAENNIKHTGALTGYTDIDKKLGGMNDGDFIVVAARPAMGKTALVLNIAVNVAAAEPAPERRGVAVFSLEMPDEQLAKRQLCSEGNVDNERMKSSELLPDDWTRLTEAAQFTAQLPIWICDQAAITLLEIRAAVRRLQAEYDRPATDDAPARRVGLIVIDYLQLMKGREDAQSREQEIGEISRGLKQLAKELRVPVIALSQLNRSVETRGKDKHPQLSDLRDSGAIEQDADVIMFIYRDEYYHPDTTQDKGVAEIDIAKQRNGSTGRVKLAFDAKYTKFGNLAQGYRGSDE